MIQLKGNTEENTIIFLITEKKLQSNWLFILEDLILYNKMFRKDQ